MNLIRYLALSLGILSLAGVSAFGALVHVTGMPEGIDEKTDGLIYLEAETPIKDDTFGRPADQERTYFRTDAKPSDFWGTQISYSKSRCGARGSDQGSASNVNIYWEKLPAKITAGEYDAYIWVLNSSNQGSLQKFAFFAGDSRLTVDEAKPLAEAATTGKGMGWMKIGRIALTPETTTFRVRIDTEKSTARFDTILLAPTTQRQGVAVKPRVGENLSEIDGHIFTADSGALRFMAWSPSIIAESKVALLDEEGRTLPGGGSITWQPINDDQAEAVVSLNSPGFYQVTMEVTYRDGKKFSAVATAGVLGPPLDESLRKQSRYGVWNVHGTLQHVIAAGGRWNRQMSSMKDLERSLIEQAPAGTGQRGSDPRRQLDDIGVLSFGFPYWLLDSVPDPKPKGFAKPFSKPRDWNELEALARAYALRPDRAKIFPYYYEIWNEPEWAWKGTDEDLVKVHEYIGKGIKSAFPDTKILGPCLASVSLSTLDKLVQRGLLNHIDALSLHTYVSGTAPEGKFISDIRALKSYMKKVGRPDMPIYFTEYGWTSQVGTWATPVNELSQARYCARSLGLLTHENIETIIYFCLLYKTSNHGEAGFSILNDDFSPKPAYVAFSTASRWLAGTQPEALLEIAPGAYLQTLRRGDQTVAMIWSVKDKHVLKLPVGVIRGADMMGRPLVIDDQTEITIGPSPYYLELKTGGFSSIATVDPVRVRQGHDVSLSVPATWCPPPLKADGRKVHVPDNAPYGQYLVLTQTSSGWRSSPINVVKPIQIESAEVRWPANEESPYLMVQNKSALDETMKIRNVLALKGVAERTGDPMTLAANGEVIQKFPLTGLVHGKRYGGQVLLKSLSGKDGDAVPADITLLSCARSVSSTVQWDRIPPMKIDDRGFSGNVTKAIDPKDCSATLQLAYSSAGLHMRVVVEDDIHHQTREPARMWQEDSLQFSLDLDADLPLQANAGGWNGHQRIFEMGIGGTPGQAVAYRWISYDPAIQQERIISEAVTTLSRIDTQTVYEVMLPWHTLGRTDAPQAGSSIGFALVVNDRDNEKDPRHGLLLFDGVSGDKAPEKFGRFWLRP